MVYRLLHGDAEYVSVDNLSQLALAKLDRSRFAKAPT